MAGEGWVRVLVRTKATDRNVLRSHKKGAPNGAENYFFDSKMSLLRLVS